MKSTQILLATLLILTHSNSFASNQQDVITIGSDNLQVLWLRHKSIKNMSVYLMGYRSPSNRQIERVIPKKVYFASIKELQELKKVFVQKRSLSSFPFCEEPIYIYHNSNKDFLCLDLFAKSEKRKVIHWVSQKANLLIR
ncbi:MAG: hypothetical protein ACXVCY_06225 [Pseudobdellovibrionaceae bacterium]